MGMIKFLKLLSGRQIDNEIMEKARQGIEEHGMFILRYEMEGSEYSVKVGTKTDDSAREYHYFYNTEGRLTRTKIITYGFKNRIFSKQLKEYEFDLPGSFIGRRIR